MRNRINNFIIFIYVMTPAMAFGAEPGAFERIVGGAQDWISSNLSSGGIMMLGGAAVLEIVLRRKKTSKALSLIHGVAKGFRMVAGLLEELARVVDELLGQRTK